MRLASKLKIPNIATETVGIIGASEVRIEWPHLDGVREARSLRLREGKWTQHARGERGALRWVSNWRRNDLQFLSA
jgi:hypothetical protein